MRAKRAKLYKKSMLAYSKSFGFRAPYIVLLDKQILEDSFQYSMDIVERLKSTLQGEVKPQISTCSIRKLYNADEKSKNEELVSFAKTIERRRCGHQERPSDDPLSDYDCITSIVDPKGSKRNKHNVIVATQDPELRDFLHEIPGCPVIKINRSNMVMEPMSEATMDVVSKFEKQTLRAGSARKRSAQEMMEGWKKNEDQQSSASDDNAAEGAADGIENEAETEMATKKAKIQPQSKMSGNEKRRLKYAAPKGANPLAIKKKKKEPPKTRLDKVTDRRRPAPTEAKEGTNKPSASGENSRTASRRRRRHKVRDAAGAAEAAATVTAEA